MSVRTYVRTSVHKVFLPTTDGMPYDPIQGQGQGHGASEFPKIALFKVCLLRHLQWEMASDRRFLN